MPTTSYQIRLCKNPDCGLRYPLINEDPFGDRCPACLGQSIIVIERPILQKSVKEKSPPKTNFYLYGLLDNIRSALNVGSIFRSADGFEFSHLYLCGITPTPDIAGVRKSSLGAEESVNWSSHKNAIELITNLKNKNYEIWALEKTPNSVEINSATAKNHKPENLVLAAGNELTGIDPGILEIVDCIVHIPMRGMKSSFNVAVAFAIAAQVVYSRLNENVNK